MKIVQNILLTSLVIGLGVLLYGIINWIIFLNLIESPLPEDQEMIPDLEIVPE